MILLTIFYLILQKSTVSCLKFLVSFGGNFKSTDGIHFTSTGQSLSGSDYPNFNNLDSKLSQCLIFPELFQVKKSGYASYKHEKFKSLYFCGGIEDNVPNANTTNLSPNFSKVNTCKVCRYGSNLNKSNNTLDKATLEQQKSINDVMDRSGLIPGEVSFKPICEDMSPLPIKNDEDNIYYGIAHGQMVLLEHNKNDLLLFIGGSKDDRVYQLDEEKPSNIVYMNMLSKDSGKPGKWLRANDQIIPSMVSARTGHRCLSVDETTIKITGGVHIVCIGGLNENSLRGPGNPLNNIEVLYKRPEPLVYKGDRRGSNTYLKKSRVKDKCVSVYSNTHVTRMRPTHYNLTPKLSQLYCWILLNTTLTTGRASFAATQIGGKIYIFGGQSLGKNNYENSIEVLEFSEENMNDKDLVFGEKVRVLSQTESQRSGRKKRNSEVTPSLTNPTSLDMTSSDTIEPEVITVEDKEMRPVRLPSKTLNCGRSVFDSEIYNKDYIILKGGMTNQSLACSEIEIFDIKNEVILTIEDTLGYLDIDSAEKEKLLNYDEKMDDADLMHDMRRFRKDHHTFTIDIEEGSIRAMFSDEKQFKNVNTSEKYTTTCDKIWLDQASSESVRLIYVKLMPLLLIILN